MGPNKIKNIKILFVCDNPPHSLHESFTKSIHADFFCYPAENHQESLNTLKRIPKDYDVYLTEGFFNYVSLLKLLGLLKKSVKIINLFSDPRLYHLYTGEKFDFKNNKVKKYPSIQKQIVKRNIKKLDGAICVGDFSSSLFKRYNKESPMINALPFIFKKRAKSLLNITPDLSNQNILFIGHGPDFHYKGIDILVEVFKKVKKNFPDAKLYILGRWDVKKEWQSKNVYFEGAQDIVPYIKKCSLSLHLGSGEAFGLNVLETMLAGVPTIVSNYTGAKEAVEKVDKNFVVPLNKGVIVKRILDYFDLDAKKKEKLSMDCRKVARKYNEEKSLKLFKENFKELLEKIEDKRK